MNSQECKEFIEKVSGEYSLPAKAKWKRTKKHKDGSATIREFQTAAGDVIVISDDPVAGCSVREVKHAVVVSDDIKQDLTAANLFLPLVKMTIDDCVSNGKHGYSVICSALNASYGRQIPYTEIPEAAISSYVCQGDDSLIWASLKGILPKSNTQFYCSLPDDFLTGSENFMTDVSPERVGVTYDTENMVFTYMKMEDISFFTVFCGGDWEIPVIAFVYWSESKQRLVGFFPTGDGNVYNQETMTAYGSEMEKLGLDYDDPNYSRLEEKYGDMMENLNAKLDSVFAKAIAAGFKQFKTHLISSAA